MRNRQIDAFKEQLFTQLQFVVKLEDIHAAFIEFTHGQPSAVVLQDSTVWGLKKAYVQVSPAAQLYLLLLSIVLSVQIYRIITELVDVE